MQPQSEQGSRNASKAVKKLEDLGHAGACPSGIVEETADLGIRRGTLPRARLFIHSFSVAGGTDRPAAFSSVPMHVHCRTGGRAGRPRDRRIA
jgi:hypothetical protein